MASTQDELLEGTFYVKEIQKERTRKRRKQMLVSWEGFDEKHNTWEPVENLPTEMVEAFRNRRKKQTKQPKKGLNDMLLKEIDRRAKFSTKSRTEREHLPKRMYKIYLGRAMFGSFLINTQDLKALVSAGKAMRRRNHS